MGKIRKDAPLLSHIHELRKLAIISILGLLAGSVVSFVFFDRIISFLYRPLSTLEAGGNGDLLYINTIFEGFLTRLKVSLLSGAVLSFPLHLFLIIYFVFPGLISKEKRIVIVTLACSFVLIVFSFLYSYFKIIPISLNFLTGTAFIPEQTGMLLGFSRNIFYIFQFMLVTLAVFQIPIVLELLMIMNIVSRKLLWRGARYSIVVFFVLAAIVTPPDFITQLSLALPLTGMYFLTLLIAKIFRFGKG